MNLSPGVTLTTTDPDATRAVGAVISHHLRAGDVVALSGELGAGKTCLVQGVAAGLKVPNRVTSPTFVLVKTYRGTLPVVHVDVYRLNRLQEVFDLGDEVFARDAVTLVEWGDAISTALPADHLEVEVLLADATGDRRDADGTRQIVLRGHGGWQPRLGPLVTDCRTWTTGGDTSDARASSELDPDHGNPTDSEA